MPSRQVSGVGVAPGWYHCPGDAEGTVRLWNGTDWVGFPQRPEVTKPELVGTGDRRGRFAGQRRLVVYSLVAVFGLLAMIAICGQLIMDLLVARDEVQAFAGSGIQLHFGNSQLSEPSEDTFGKWILHFLGAGLLFLVWEWRAYRNIPQKWLAREPRFGFVGSWNASKGPWGVEHVLFHVIGLVTGPMFMLAEHSPDVRRASVSPMNPVLVWLWACTWGLSVLAGLVGSFKVFSIPLGNPEEIRVWLTVMIGALIAHIVSLCCALRLIQQITKYQDARLRRRS